MSIFYEAEDDKIVDRLAHKRSLNAANDYENNTTSNTDRYNKARNMTFTHDENKDTATTLHAIDAADRHLRRHPQHEFTSIFY